MSGLLPLVDFGRDVLRSFFGQATFPGGAYLTARIQFLNFDAHYEMGSRITTAPTVHFPARLKIFNLGTLPQVEGRGLNAPVKYLRTKEKRF